VTAFGAWVVPAAIVDATPVFSDIPGALRLTHPILFLSRALSPCQAIGPGTLADCRFLECVPILVRRAPPGSTGID
jgi:hypothetical protein